MVWGNSGPAGLEKKKRCGKDVVWKSKVSHSKDCSLAHTLLLAFPLRPNLLQCGQHAAPVLKFQAWPRSLGFSPQSPLPHPHFPVPASAAVSLQLPHRPPPRFSSSTRLLLLQPLPW